MSGWWFVFVWVVLAVGISMFLHRREQQQRERKQKAEREAKQAGILENAAQAAASAFTQALLEYNWVRIRDHEPTIRISTFEDVLEQMGELVWDKHLLPKHAMMIESHPSMFAVSEDGHLWSAFLNQIRLESAEGERMETEALEREKVAPETVAQRAAYLDRREQ